MTLRDIDWRFVLPAPRDGGFRLLLLLGADSNVAEELRAIGLARDVALAPKGRKADAVVCLRSASVSLADASALVEENGVVYYETSRRLRCPIGASPECLRRRLERLGLSRSALYGVHPAFAGPRTYFPLDAEGAVRWYAGSSSTARDDRIATVIARAARMKPAWLGRLVPRVAVAAEAGKTHGRPWMPVPLEALPVQLRRLDLHPLVLLHGHEERRVVAFPFAAGDSEPLAVVKFDRDQRSSSTAAAEQASLREIHRKLDPELRSTVPEPLGLVDSTAVAGAAESFLAGERLYTRWASSRLSWDGCLQDLELVTEWLTRFQSSSLVDRRAWTETDVYEHVERPLAAYEDEFALTRAESILFARVRQRARRLIGQVAPVVWEHGDFTSANILRDGPAVRVIDWSGAAPGLPLVDLLYFLMRWLDHVGSRAETPAALRAALSEAEPRQAPQLAVRAAIERYLVDLGIEHSSVPLLTTNVWVRRAVARSRRERRLHAEPAEAARAEARARNRYVAQVEVLAAAVEGLFARWTDDCGPEPRRSRG